MRTFVQTITVMYVPTRRSASISITYAPRNPTPFLKTNAFLLLLFFFSFFFYFIFLLLFLVFSFFFFSQGWVEMGDPEVYETSSPCHTVGYTPFIKCELASHNQLGSVMGSKFDHDVVTFSSKLRGT